MSLQEQPRRRLWTQEDEDDSAGHRQLGSHEGRQTPGEEGPQRVHEGDAGRDGHGAEGAQEAAEVVRGDLGDVDLEDVQDYSSSVSVYQSLFRT